MRLILIIASLPQLPNREAHGDRHHRRDRLEPLAIEVTVLEMDAAQRIHQLGGYAEPLAQDLLEVRSEGATAGKHQFIDRTLGRGRGEEVEGLLHLAGEIARDAV